jgi:hypothetical protein
LHFFENLHDDVTVQKEMAQEELKEDEHKSIHTRGRQYQKMDKVMDGNSDLHMPSNDLEERFSMML